MYFANYILITFIKYLYWKFSKVCQHFLPVVFINPNNFGFIRNKFITFLPTYSIILTFNLVPFWLALQLQITSLHTRKSASNGKYNNLEDAKIRSANWQFENIKHFLNNNILVYVSNFSYFKNIFLLYF